MHTHSIGNRQQAIGNAIGNYAIGKNDHKYYRAMSPASTSAYLMATAAGVLRTADRVVNIHEEFP